jgi:hypothetical protein
MITNVPTADDLQSISLRLYFKAWADVVQIVSEFEDIHMVGPVLGPSEEQEWEGYLRDAQSDLQGIYSLLQQSQEIGLKALIAAVSPFLLLKRHEAKISTDGTYDFSDFPTLDASDLIRVHNVFCSRQLSAAFSGAYDELRRGRNKIAHLGLFQERLEPMRLIGLMLLQYRELYLDRRWLPDRYRFASLHRWAHMESREWTSRSGVLVELWRVIPWLKREEFELVFGRPADQARFICPICAQDLNRGSEPYPADVPTAFLTDSLDGIECALCLNRSAVCRGACSDTDCKSQLFAESGERHDAMCLVCGAEPV